MAGDQKAVDGRQARWRKHNEERRQQILQAAVEVIERQPPGTEFHVQQIAEQAGLNRTVVYRHFADRADLDEAIQARIMGDVSQLLVPGVSLEGTINDIIRRVVGTYVDWVSEHPALLSFAEQSRGAIGLGAGQVATVVVEVLELAIELLEVELGDDEVAAVDPLANGLVGAVMGAVHRWQARGKGPPAPEMAELISQSVWHILNGHALRHDLVLDPDMPLVDLINQVSS